MNIHALKTCAAARRWRALADFFLENKQTCSSLTGMPKEFQVKSTKELTTKDLCSLYILCDRKLERRAPKLTRADEKRLEEKILMYKRDYFTDNFGDDGYLERMSQFEDDKGESMADIIDTKYGTNLPLTWTSSDTRKANELGKIIRSDYRSETEGGDDTVELTQWHAFIEFETRHRIIAEREAMNKKTAVQAKQSGELLLSL